MTTDPATYDDQLEHACEATLGLFHFFLEQSIADVADTYRTMASTYAETMPGHPETQWCVDHLRKAADNAEWLMECLRIVSQLPDVVTPDEADAIVDPICDRHHQAEQPLTVHNDFPWPAQEEVAEFNDQHRRMPTDRAYYDFEHLSSGYVNVRDPDANILFKGTVDAATEFVDAAVSPPKQ